MRLDEKGVSPLIGFILMLMILMISISALQSTYVPSVCKSVEADHIKKLTSQLIELKDVDAKTLKFDMGVDYPDYIFLITPKSTATTINVRSFNITVEYTEILANGTKVYRKNNFTSYRIEITPNYVFYPENTLIMENTAIFKHAGSIYINMSDQSAFSDIVNFVMYDVSFQSISTTQSLSIISVPSSTGGRIIAENLTISFDSIYPEYWESIDGYNVSVDGSRVSVHRDGTILLSLKHLSLYSGTQLSSTSPSPVRIIKVNTLDNFSLKSGESVTLAAKVLDSYNNPVEGVPVTVNSTIGSVSPSSLYTDSEGEVYTIFSAESEGTGTVYFTCENCTSEQITGYGVSVTSVTGSNSSISITLTSSPPAAVDGYSSKTINAYVSSNGDALPGYEVRFATNSSDANLNTEAITNFTGYATTTISQSAQGKHWYKVYGYAGSIFNYITVLLNTTLPSNVHILKIYVENTGSEDLTDFPVEISITDSSLLNMMQDDGSGIRFFESLVGNPYSESAGKIPHWIEEQPSSGELDVWVNLDLSSGENKTIFMYFNGTASSESNGSAVFDFFDDFDDGDVSDWDSVNANIQAKTFDGKKTLKLNPTGSTNFKHFAVPDNTIELGSTYIVEAHLYDDKPAGGPLLHYVDDGNWWGLELYTGGNKDIFRPYIGNSDRGWVYSNSPCSISSDDWYKIKVIAEPDGFVMYIDDSLKWDKDVGVTYQLSGYNKVGFVEHSGFGPLYADWIFVRDYVENEPAVTIGELLQ